MMHIKGSKAGLHHKNWMQLHTCQAAAEGDECSNPPSNLPSNPPSNLAPNPPAHSEHPGWRGGQEAAVCKSECISPRYTWKHRLSADV